MTTDTLHHTSLCNTLKLLYWLHQYPVSKCLIYWVHAGVCHVFISMQNWVHQIWRTLFHNH